MNSLRQMHSQFAVAKAPVTSNSIYSLRQYISALSHYTKKLEKSIEHWQRFQYGQERRPPETIFHKPSCVQQIMSLDEKFLREKEAAETRKKGIKRRRQSVLQQN